MNWQLLLNPFDKFSEKNIFIFGIIASIIGSYITFLSGATFDGLIEVHLNPQTTFFIALKENSLHIVLITVLLFLLGKIINKRTRFIDVLNAALLFRVPFYFMSLLLIFPFLQSLDNEIKKNPEAIGKLSLNPFDLAMILLITCVLISLLVYSIVLLYKGFKTATNVKKPLHYVFFGVIILFAEILSRIILPLI
ncbi:hypothetical protein GCM10011508_05970 [Flavobacterium lutivivi]|nr:hypothetical protein GCM10011508_05970 [Flavobacterium lutivivi]